MPQADLPCTSSTVPGALRRGLLQPHSEMGLQMGHLRGGGVLVGAPAAWMWQSGI